MMRPIGHPDYVYRPWSKARREAASKRAKARIAKMKMENPRNHLPRIDAIYAILSVDDGGEGVVAAPIYDGFLSVPLIAADTERLKDILPVARIIASKSGKRMRLVRFHAREEIEVIEP